jgi:hypothetical protein
MAIAIVDPLIAAWKAWDLHSGHDVTSKRMEDACKAEALALGVDTTELRIVLSGMVRRGLKRDEALGQVRRLFAE